MIAAAMAVAACAVGWVALPALQGSQNAVERETAIKLERARRLLHQYLLPQHPIARACTRRR